MSLEAGTRLGSYEIVAPLGSGGMGEVYRARDSKLGREVAIKVLPAAVAGDAERLSRFEREARVLASLNHANIATVHGFERQDGTSFLVMELVEGDTLADVLQRGAMPVRAAIPLFLQIAEGLEAAHDKGIVHRDLKPANIKVGATASGSSMASGAVKILDFGLAKAMAPESPGTSEDPALSASPTLTLAATQRGEILGTAAYMSPEQASGEEIDKRADVWAFGVCLYEALTGTRLFGGEKMSMVLASVLKDEPDLDLLPAETPPAVVRLLRRCLEKEAHDRLHDIADARLELREALDEPPPSVAAGGETAASRRSPLPVAVAAVAAGAMIAAIAAWSLKPTPPPPERRIARFLQPLPADQTLTFTGRRALAISPDATRFAYTANNRLYLRALDQLAAQPVAGVEGIVTRPFFSPESDWLAFYYEGQLVKVAVSGGAPVALCDIDNPTGASWERDGTILFGQGGEGIYRVADSGGTPELLVDGEQEPGRHLVGQLLPGGRAVLFSHLGGGGARILAQILDTGERVEIIDGTAGRFVATDGGSSRGHLLFVRDGVLLAVAFDALSLSVSGGPVPILEGVRDAFGAGGYQFDLADNGTLLYARGASALDRTSLVVLDRGGAQVASAAQSRAFAQPRVSPDGRYIVSEVVDNQASDLWVYDIDRRTSSRITSEDASDDNPVWSPDGRRVAFRSTRAPAGIYQKAADGTGEAELLLEGGNKVPTSWSRDGRWLLFHAFSGNGANIGVLAIGDDAPPRWIVQGAALDFYAQLSPDGRYVAFTSNLGGVSFEIYVVPFDEAESRRWTISTGGGFGAFWSADGHELFYLGGRQDSRALMAVTVDTESTFAAGNPVELFPWPIDVYLPARGVQYDVTPDGGFVAVKVGEGADETGSSAEELVVVQNWTEELRARVPLGP